MDMKQRRGFDRVGQIVQPFTSSLTLYVKAQATPSDSLVVSKKLKTKKNNRTLMQINQKKPYNCFKN